jgi:hypothetical protein
MLRASIHYVGLVVGLAGALAFVGLRIAAHQYLDPDRSWDDRLTTFFFPASARASDFLPPGWQLVKRSWFALLVAVVGGILWGVTASRV